MIGRAELLDMASRVSLSPHVVEKDYVLGWVLAGLACQEEVADSWVFKGGTCLKKCLFETYRFSVDLDFTLLDPAHLDCQGKLSYRGPISPTGKNLPRIKIDLSADECVVEEPQRMPVLHPYSDMPREGIRVLAYSYAEVFGEKVRALGDRTRPRDLYDVIHLYRQHAPHVRRNRLPGPERDPQPAAGRTLFAAAQQGGQGAPACP
ncbi:MAG: nucleotidyl transferase AbiEii/AbiGii toxin family protein [Chlorobium sp.]|nr:nucleotidyl transferase AbiEii/AbiGii toxin family protein [Chlorobium phaeovibrioides]NQU45432.1 nucleotidyl transferase AbiEii/AbiGii toxin family protein [Chlorobium sp.]